MPARRLWWGPPRRKSQSVEQRWPPTGRSCREGPLRKGSPEISQSFLMMSLPSRVVISLTLVTDSAEMRALPTGYTPDGVGNALPIVPVTFRNERVERFENLLFAECRYCYLGVTLSPLDPAHSGPHVHKRNRLRRDWSPSWGSNGRAD